MLTKIGTAVAGLALAMIVSLAILHGVFSSGPALADAASRDVICTATISPGGITTNTTFASAAIKCPQVHMGDFVYGVSALTTDPGNVQITGYVQSAGNIVVKFSNTSAGTITPASDTYSVIVKPRYISP